MAEMILPGTYIEVRDEGLIVVGPISVNNLGIVGTARQGPTNKAVILSSASQAHDIFGEPDPLDQPETANQPLSLVRAIDLAYANGAQTVYAVRVASDTAQDAEFTIQDDAAQPIDIKSLFPGDSYNKAKLNVIKPTGSDNVNVSFNVGRMQEVWRDVPSPIDEFAAVIAGKKTDYSYQTLSSTGGQSQFFTVVLPDPLPDPVPNIAPGDAALSADTTKQGTSGADATLDDYKKGLQALANQNVHIVVLAGMAGTDVNAALGEHLTSTSNDTMKRERIAVVGGDIADVGNPNPPGNDSGRVVFVGQKLLSHDAKTGREIVWPVGYTAAAVGGLIASLPAHVSTTNKVLVAEDLDTVYNGGELEQLVLGHVLGIEKRRGTLRVVKGITTSENTAWTQITTRRIVDYAIFGIRSGCDPYIGKLNNDQVRQRMKSTLLGFLKDMADREMLVGYSVDVSATREQQIRGICQVTMTVQPTFSIDYIKVTMYLS
jgi:hypothetical protein